MSEQSAAGRPVVTSMIELGRLIPTPDNPRKVSEKDPAVISLAKSIQAHGILQPLIARPHPKKPGFYDLRAGCRRYCAAKVAGLEAVPVFVRELDDQAAIEITVTENLQRENLSPLEEARGIELLLKHKGWDTAAIAAHLGKSQRWVHRRAHLAHLSPKWQKEMEDPNSAISGWSAGHLDIIARFAPPVQDRLLREYQWGEVPTIAELERETTDTLGALKTAPWALDDATIEPKAGACLKCSKRTGAQGWLFSDEEDVPVVTDDRCLDAECWGRKMAAQVKLTISAAKKDHREVVVVAKNAHDLPAALANMAASANTGYGAAENLRAKPTPTSTPVVPLDGPHAGRLMFRPKIGGGFPGRDAARDGKRSSDGRPGPTPLAVRRENLNKRRDALLIKTVCERLEEIVRSADEIAEASKLIHRGELSVEALVLAFPLNHLSEFSGTRDLESPDDWKAYDQLRKRASELPARLLIAVFETWMRDLLAMLKGRNADTGFARRICEIIDVDWKGLVADVAESIPEPASWRGLNADGTPKKGKGTEKKATKPAKPTKGKAKTPKRQKVKTSKQGAAAAAAAGGAK